MSKKNKGKELPKKEQQATETQVDATPEQVETKPEMPESAQAAEQEQRLAELEQALRESEERYLRLAAEYDNFRKRSQKEKDQLYQDSLVDVVTELLPLFDNLDRAQEAAHKASEAESASEEARQVAEGVHLVVKQGQELLHKLGIQEIEALNASFDPQIHSAVMHEENETVGENTVVDVFMKGYRHGERVIRHSLVKVAN